MTPSQWGSAHWIFLTAISGDLLEPLRALVKVALVHRQRGRMVLIQFDEDLVGWLIVDGFVRTRLKRCWRIDGKHLPQPILAGHYFAPRFLVPARIICCSLRRSAAGLPIFTLRSP